MFCPQCGQEQATQEMRFCARCGFPLGLISEILAHGGFLPQLADMHKDKRILTRRNGLILALFWFFTFVLILTPIAGIAGIGRLAGMLSVVGFFGGLLILLASLFFLEKPLRSAAFLQNARSANLPGTNAHPNALPNATAIPAADFVPPISGWKSPDTADLSKPPSIIEGTTKLLERDQ